MKIDLNSFAQPRLIGALLVCALSGCNSLAVSNGAPISSSLPRSGYTSQQPFQAELVARISDPALHDGINSAAFSPNGELLAIGSMHAYEIVIWSLKESRVVHRLKMPGGLDENSLIWSPDGQRLATFLGRTIYIFNTRNGILEKSLELDEGRGGFSSIAFDLLGTQLLAVCELRDKNRYELAVYETSGWNRKTFTIQPAWFIKHAFFANTENKIVLLGNDRPGRNLIALLDVQTGNVSPPIKVSDPKLTPQFEFPTARVEIRGIGINRSGTQLAAVLLDGKHSGDQDSLLLIDTSTLSVAHRIPVPQGLSPVALQYTPDGQHLFLVPLRQPIQVFDTASGQKIGELPNEISLGGLAFNSNGSMYAVGNGLHLFVYHLKKQSNRK